MPNRINNSGAETSSSTHEIKDKEDFVHCQILTEIQRFESVHPCIYRIYDLVEKMKNDQTANLIRQQVIL